MSTQSIKILYRIPANHKMVLRYSLDGWQTDIAPTRVEGDMHEFRISTLEPFFQFKPCLLTEDNTLLWSRGGNYLSPVPEERSIYPHFHDPEHGCISDLQELEAADGRPFRYRVYLPPGYHENELRTYPVCLMHDGHNLFFPDEAFAGRTWEVNRTLELLDKMNSIEPCVLVALYPRDRERDYTLPGAAVYADFLRNKLLPAIESQYRTKKGPEHRAVIGSSLGGLVSFYLVWDHDDLFLRAACLSSTFDYDLRMFRKVQRSKRKRNVKIYLDSGWPGDNFAPTQAMTHMLLQKGYSLGQDISYLAVPEAEHSEAAWASRLHLPFQFLLGLNYGRDATIDLPAISTAA